MKRIVTILSRDGARTAVADLAARGIAGMTLIEAAPSDADAADAGGTGGGGAEVSAAGFVRLEIVIESHRADEVIECVEALLDSAETGEPRLARLVVEDVAKVVHIRSGRVLV